MKNYTITVNGNVYDVTVEEKGAGAAPVAPAAPKAAPKAAPAPAPKAASAGAGSIQVKAGAAGKVAAAIKNSEGGNGDGTDSSDRPACRRKRGPQTAGATVGGML